MGQVLHGSATTAEAIRKRYLFLVGQTSYSYDRETAAIRSLQALKPAAVMFNGVIELDKTAKHVATSVFRSWRHGRFRAIPSTCLSVFQIPKPAD